MRAADSVACLKEAHSNELLRDVVLWMGNKTQQHYAAPQALCQLVSLGRMSGCSRCIFRLIVVCTCHLVFQCCTLSL